MAISELVWNALDADAQHVEVQLVRGALGSIEEVRIKDDGHGIPHNEAPNLFSSLGGSWKRNRRRSREIGRALHGKDGKGRFRAFALGSSLEWQTRWRENGITRGYSVNALRARLMRFEIGDAIESASPPGTTVIVRQPQENLGSLEGASAVQRVAQELAPYLLQYPNIEVTYDGQRITPSALDVQTRTIDLEPVEVQEGCFAQAKLLIVEWNTKTQRALYLCDEDGVALLSMPPGIHAPGFEFTAYLRSQYLRSIANEKGEELLAMDPGVALLVDAAKAAMRDHFRERSAELSRSIVEQWREDHVYPYEGEPADAVERVERQVFDVLALNVHAYLPSFEEGDVENKRLSFRLLRAALRESPEAVTKILTEVLGLPQQRQQELAELLDRTPLSAIIGATRMVAGRLDFLRGLEALVFDAKQETLERRQLHQIVADETWIFGEHFALANSDQSLTEVLRKHRQILGDDVVIDEPVTRDDGSQGYPDVVCSRRIPQTKRQDHEFLVVELKRPSVKVDADALTQIKRYAHAITTDERFDRNRTRWEFVVLSNELDDFAEKERTQPSRPQGIVQEGGSPSYRIWARTWAEVINDARARLSVYQENLELEVTRESGIRYLRETYAKYLPDSLSDEEEEQLEHE